MNYDLSFWLTFTVIFMLWFFVRVNRHKSNKIFQKRVLKSLNKLSGETDKLDIGKINKEIRERMGVIRSNQKAQLKDRRKGFSHD